MSRLFLSILNMSISASWLVLAVLLLRPLFKKAPKWVSVLLWGFVAVRLVCPFSVESALSLIPSAQTVSPDIMISPAPQINSGINVLNNAINPVISEAFTPEPLSSVNSLQVWISLASLIWLAGFAAMLIYTAVSYFLLRRRVDAAVRLRNNIYQSEYVASPFVLGIVRPKIYLPFQIDGQDMDHVIAHEQAHIRRRDHWWKPFGFLLLALHWFNPLMWLGYILLCRDIELACDEKVIKEMDSETKADYSQALVACSVHRRSIAACPLAFGEVGVKERVKSVMNYKKPAFWIILGAVIICIAVAVCFLTNPADSYGIGIRSVRGSTYIQNGRTPAIELDYFLLIDGEEYLRGGRWIRQLSEDEPEYTKDGSVPYDGRLGKYRLMLNFPKTGPSASFRKSHEEGKIYLLEGMPGSFKDGVRYKAVYPEDGGMILYFGSDVPFGFKEPGMFNVRYIRGPIQIRLYRFADPAPGPHSYSSEVITWFDFGRDSIDWDRQLETTIEQFPGVIFRATAESIEAETYNGIKTLYSGMPIWNTFFFDMTEDGYPDLCSTVSRGSGIVDTHVVVYDYVHRKLYTLEDRMNYDYSLRENDGALLVDKRRYKDSAIVATDKVFLVDGRLQLVQDMEVLDGLLQENIAKTFTTGLTTYYQLKNGKWMNKGGSIYEYRLEITGRMPNAKADSTFVYLSNLKNISFSRAWKAAGLSSNMDDYFLPDEAVLVDWTTGPVDSAAEKGSGEATQANQPVTALDAAISEAIRGYHKSDKPDGLINTENHMVLVNEAVSGTPLNGQTGHIGEQTVYVYYLYQKFSVAGESLEERQGIFGQATITFDIDENGKYTLKHFIKPESSVNHGVSYSQELIQKFVAASEKIAENEEAYNRQLRDACRQSATDYLKNIEEQSEPPAPTKPLAPTEPPVLTQPLAPTEPPVLTQPLVPIEPPAPVEPPTEDNAEITDYKQLTVAGKKLPSGQYMVFCDTKPRYVLVPFTTVIRELGAEINWKSETVAQILFNGKAYTLNTQTVSLVEDGSNLNCIIPTPGGSVHSQAMDYELLLDNATLKTVAMFLGLNIKVAVDYPNYQVVIDQTGT